jgi:hypothetical protein
MVKKVTGNEPGGVWKWSGLNLKHHPGMKLETEKKKPIKTSDTQLVPGTRFDISVNRI